MRDHLPPSTMKNKGRFFFSTINSTLIFSLLAFLALFAFVAPLPSLSSHSPSHHRHRKKLNIRKFEIADDKFWKDGEPFRIIGGDLHYFRVLPEYWEDRLLRAKALGLNTIQTYVPWNLHEPSPGDLKFNGIADIVSFLKLCQKLGFFVMLRPGPYICAEWDLGGFPAWLLATEPTLRLRSSDPMYLELIENEYGSYADDKAYLHHLVKLARRHLGDDIILYTTDGGTRVTLKKGTILGDNVYSAVDFTTGDQPWPIFKLQKEFNAPGKSPPLSSEFYTGWLTHWGEKLAKTDADFTAAELEKILLRNGSVVLYMAHGGTNFGFYNGANTGSDDSDYKPDLTSYDYDAPIRETGDVDNAKFRAIRKVIEKYTVASLPPIPANNEKAGYGFVKLEKTSKLFDIIGIQDDANVVESVNPISMESVGQMHGFLLYISEFSKRDSASTLSISKVHDRAQVFVSCHSKDQGRPIYAGIIERWSNKELKLPHLKCVSKISLFVLVENMGRINYGPYISDRKGILSPVYVDGRVLHNWKMFSIPLHNLNDQSSSIIQLAGNDLSTVHAGKRMQDQSKNISNEPAFYTGSFTINSANQVKDTFLSVDGWGKGLAFINNFNLGRYWPTFGPQCNLYVPAPLLRHGSNTVVLFELDSPNTDLAVRFVQHEDFSCSQTSSNILEI
ncbi:beta-galactosidase 17-like isoform X2 [Chenopodium quinoa]|uniref:beta-galactosidase 17-like isoform X2 n=1 Tax=Chenopodium quinoa TaxID=63459 RepID=UPI000B7935C9|nr:beta-galactosidase 17-like isoform X2 [Chenopodium quinoa]